MKRHNHNPAENVYTAQVASNLAKVLVKDRKRIVESIQNDEEILINFGLPALDGYLNPFMEGDLITILGRPQNGKTLIAMWLLDTIVNRCLSFENKVVILVTTEVTVERSILYQLARICNISVRSALRGELTPDELKGLDMAALKIGSMPLFIIGHSSKRSKDNKRARPQLTPENIEKCIEYIFNHYKDEVTGTYVEPALIVIDYLQRLYNANPIQIPPPQFYSGAVDWAKNLAFWGGCPVVLNVQAGREVDTREIKMPTMKDGQFTSNIEQSSDFSFGTWMPKTCGYEIVKNAHKSIPSRLQVTDRLLLLSCLKQKDGPAGSWFPLYVEPEHLKVGQMQI